MKKMFDETLVTLRLVKMKFDYSEKEIHGNNVMQISKKCWYLISLPKVKKTKETDAKYFIEYKAD